VKDIEKIMTEKKISSVLIEDQGSIIGIIKENIRLSY
jgi:CBS domain-containing protein